jgi:hypothetical protein
MSKLMHQNSRFPEGKPFKKDRFIQLGVDGGDCFSEITLQACMPSKGYNLFIKDDFYYLRVLSHNPSYKRK